MSEEDDKKRKKKLKLGPDRRKPRIVRLGGVGFRRRRPNLSFGPRTSRFAGHSGRGLEFFPRHKPPYTKPIPYGRYGWSEPSSPKPTQKILYDPEARQILSKLEKMLNEKSEENQTEHTLDKVTEENNIQKLAEELGIEPDGNGEIMLQDVLEKLADRDGMTLFPLYDLEAEEKAEKNLDDVKDTAEVGEENTESNVEIEKQSELNDSPTEASRQAEPDTAEATNIQILGIEHSENSTEPLQEEQIEHQHEVSQEAVEQDVEQLWQEVQLEPIEEEYVEPLVEVEPYDSY